jgi:hypothetical protein
MPRLRSLVPIVLLAVALASCGQGTTPGIDLDVRVVTTDGGPRQGLSVSVGDDLRTTDATGTARFAGIPAPYDAAVFRQQLPVLVHTFRGLTAPAPDLVLADTVFEALLPALAPATNPRRATVPVPVGNPGPDQVWVACLESAEVALYGCVGIGPGTPAPYEIDASWYGPSSLDAKLHAVLVQTSGGLPTSFPAYRVGEVNGLGDGPVAPPTLSPGVALPSQTVTATVQAPPNLRGTSLSALVRVSGALAMPFVYRIPVTPGASVSLTLPKLGDGPVQLLGRGEVRPCPITPLCISRSVGWLADVPDGADVQLELPAPPLILEPARDGLQVGPSTPLRIADTLEGAVTFFGVDLTAVRPSLAVTSASATTTFPDPADVGLGAAPTPTYLVFAMVVPDVDSPDAWLDAFGPMTVAERTGGPGTTRSGSLAITPWRNVAFLFRPAPIQSRSAR